jgi:hypothetical protein
MHLSFDNLEINQLEIKRFLSEEKWKSIYMGGDGQFTMYIDGVRQEFAISSTSVIRYPLDKPIAECFETVRNAAKIEIIK